MEPKTEDRKKSSPPIQQNVRARNVMIGDKNVMVETHKSSPGKDSPESSVDDVENEEFPALLSQDLETKTIEVTAAGEVKTDQGVRHKLTYAQVIQNFTAKKATVINYINSSPVQTPERNAPPLTRQESEINDFLNAVKGFKRGHLILITGGIEREKAIQSIGLVPWTVVFDFDPKSRSDGLLSQAEIPIARKRALHIKTLQDKCVITEQGTDWIFLKGLREQPDTITDDKFQKWKKQTQSWIDQIIEQLKRFGGSYTDYYVVVIWPTNEKLYPHLKHLLDELEVLGLCEFVIVAEKHDERSDTSENIFEQMQEDYEKKPTLIRLSVNEVCTAINRVFLQSNAHETAKYNLPTVDSSPVSIDDREAQWLKEDLEVLYKQSPYNFEMTLEKLKEESDNFFRGGNYPWHMWYATGAGQVDAERVIMKDIIGSLKKHHIEVFKSGRVTLFHAPGSGGTTLAQRILWELRNETPCVQVKLRTGSSDVANRIQFLYDKTRLPILILVDGEDEQRVDLLVQDLKEICFVILYVKRYPYPMEGRNDSSKCFWLKRFVSKHEATTIAYKFLQQCDTQSKRLSIEKLQREVETGAAKHEIFEFGLATYKHHYKGIESYVNGFLKLDSSSDGELLPWQHALGILSLVYFYGQMAMPCKFFTKLLRYYPLHSTDDFPLEMDALITKDPSDGRSNVVRISHYLVAKEILEQILSKPFPRGDRVEQLCSTARRKLEPFAVDFIRHAAKSAIEKSTGMIEKIMTRTFISRDNKAVGETDLVDKPRKPKFAQILHDVSSQAPYSERFHILEELVRSFPHEPQFLAHLGRLYSICKPEDEESAEQCFKTALEICRKIVGDFDVDEISHSMRLTLMHIYHMYGSMFLVRVSKYTGKTFGDQPRKRISDDNAERVLSDLFPMVENACSYFTRCRDVTPQGLEESHGFLGEIKIRLMLCDFIFRHIAKRDIYTFIKEYEKVEIADFVEDSIAVIDELVLECLSVVDPEKIEQELQVCQEWFASLFEIHNISRVVFRTKDTVKSRRLQITARKLRYQKKKIFGVLEEVTNRTDIEFIVKNYEANFKDVHESGIESPRKAIDLDYREWLFAIRHKLLRLTYTIEDVLKQVRLWHDKVKTPNSRFYLFILCSLLGFRGSTELLIEAQHIKEDLLKQSKYVTKPRYPREWLGTGLGIRCLTPETRFFGLIEGREIKGNFNSDCVKSMFGTICSPNDKPAQGYIRLDLGDENPVGINVFYVPVKSDMKGPAYADTRVEFYVGFSMAHGYEAYNVRRLKRVKCRKCGLYLEVRSNSHTKCQCGEVMKPDQTEK